MDPPLPSPAATSLVARHRWARWVLAADPAHGPLPVMLVGLTVLTGVVDAVSILALGRVFVANMTGNVVFVGFALAHAPGFSLAGSLAALAGFLVGAGAGGLLGRRVGHDRARLLASGSAVELLLFALVLLLIAVSGSPLSQAVVAVAAGVLAVGTGMQNAVVRQLAVPDLTTTVLTMTLTGIAADVRGGRPSPAFARRVLSLASMLVGAVVGAELVLRVSATAGLAAGTAVLASVTVAAVISTRRPGAWRLGSTPTSGQRTPTRGA